MQFWTHFSAPWAIAPSYLSRCCPRADAASTWHRARRQDLWRRARIYNHKACLAQLAEHKALNLKVVGSSLTVNIFFCLCHWFIFYCPDFFVYAADLSVRSIFFVFVTDLFFIVQIFLFMPLICPCFLIRCFPPQTPLIGALASYVLVYYL
jgi:hypothetical protein